MSGRSSWFPVIMLMSACASNDADSGIPCLVEGTRTTLDPSEVATAGTSAVALVAEVDQSGFEAQFTPLPSGETQLDQLTWSVSIDGDVFEQESRALDGESPPTCLSGVVLHVPVSVAVDSEQGIHAERTGFLLATGEGPDEWWIGVELPVDLPTHMGAAGSDACAAGESPVHTLTATNWPDNPWAAIHGNVERREEACSTLLYQWERND